MNDFLPRSVGPSRAPRSIVGDRRRSRLWVSVVAVSAVVMGGLTGQAAYAADVTTAVFAGGTGTVSVGSTLFAKSGGALTLTLTTSNDTRCVDVSGAFTAHLQSTTTKTSWTFMTTAGAGDGGQTVTASASPNFNPQDNCTGTTRSRTASYTLDNSGPIVTAALTPPANAAGWNNTGTTVGWTATDAGSGVASGPTPLSSSESVDGIVSRTSGATDRLGNVGTGSLTVRIDKAAPVITGVQVKNPDGTSIVTFTCADGVGSGIATCLASGATTNSKTVQPGSTLVGTATDVAGNVSTRSVTVAAADTTAPTLSGKPTTAPNGNGWYAGDVVIGWSAADAESGVPTPPSNATITGEGTGLTSTTTATNGVGLTITATSFPAVNIDRTAPRTNVNGTSNAWTNGSLTFSLTATDTLSTVEKTQYAVDGGILQTGTTFTLSAEGEHAVTYFSSDRAGNVEATQRATIRIDATAPAISHQFSPLAADGAWVNHDVTVTFSCADQGGSGVASCTAPVLSSAEGVQGVTGTATDGAGNTATDLATVRIDKTPPSLTAAPIGVKNAAGWYRADLTVSYSASDALSGITGTPATTILGEGANQSASATVSDAAGNSTTEGVTGINVDLTPPVLEGTFSDGWHTDDVTVHWVCTDALSGVAAAPADTIVAGEGDNLSSSTSCTDIAGNAVTTTVTGIRIDRSAPTTTATVPEPLDSGWHPGAVLVTLTGSDNLSATTTYFSVDSGPARTYAGAFSFATEGEHSIAFWSTDAAGNTETVGAPLTLKIDTTAPVTTVINPISPATGWFVTSGIPVAFSATDVGAGIAATHYTIDDGAEQTYGEPFIANLSTGPHTIVYWSVDLAGNAEDHATTNTIAVNVDTDAPTISGVATPAANGFGWNNTDVTVAFTCDDDGSGVRSGVAGCAGDTVLINDGAGQSVNGDAVDVAGNTSRADVTDINIDTVKPTLTGVPSDANGAGWHNTDVAVSWVGDDALSGIDLSTQPRPSTITDEGSDLSAGPVTISDRAGNVSDAASVTGIKIDRTAPTITGGATTSPNGDGWYNADVTIDFACTDILSGVASCPTSQLLRGDGLYQQVTSGPATDNAGNTASGKLVGGINIDGTAPSSSSNNLCSATNGWCTGEAATVVLAAVDQAGLSGVQEIRYSIDGGAERVAAGATATVSIPLTGSGSGTVSYYAVDVAGNEESANSVTLRWDNIAPTVTHILAPKPNADGWNSADVTVTFTAKDDDKGSGVATVTAPVVIGTETAGIDVAGSATDTAGNIGVDTVTVKLDKTRPTITAAITSGILTASGWYNGPVTVTFTCTDALSSIATCPDPVILTANGTNAARGIATDRAGNTAVAGVQGIRIDQEAPTLTTANVNVNGITYTLGSVATATCTATDSFSGLASCTVTVTGGKASGVGTFTYTATAIDNAGNRSTLTGTFSVVYRFDGFLQPINDTAHQIGASTSVFRGGSTVPVKFQLRNASGALVSSSTAPVWLTPSKGSAMSAPVDETVYTLATDSQAMYRYDESAKQYIYNWKSGPGGHYWRIGVALDDGRAYFVNIGLR